MDDEEDEGLETCSILITQYLHPGGVVGYTIKRRGEANLSTQVGLLELAKLSLIEDFKESAPE